MLRRLLVISLLFHVCVAEQPPQPPVKKWATLNGEAPLVIARGGFSGLFPESSTFANEMASQMGNQFNSTVVLFCNLQLTKDGIGMCLTDIRLENSTNVAMIFPKGSKTYNINGEQVKGWFSVDYTSDVIFNKVSLVQSVLSRTNAFDGQMPVSTLEDVAGAKPSLLWVNAQYDTFYTEHKLSLSGFLEKAMRFMSINKISSPEIGFLKTMNSKVNKAKTKLILQVLDPDVVEPTTKQTYSEILNNLAAIRAYASGILVPKAYILPVNGDDYLGNPTTLVDDAHKIGLEVYASGFANDMPASYNYSYDPTAEYLQFINFSVDGLLTDFSPTASAAIACFTNDDNTILMEGKTLIITHNGASGVYPGCSDLAYEQALKDGADIIDCSVQMSKDGVAFCLDKADLTEGTTAMSIFASRSTSIPEVQKEKGIFSFDLTWTEIQTLKPQMVSPFGQTAGFQRNPQAKNKGKIITLSDFLEIAMANAVTGILINVQNAAYLASKRGLDVVDSVNKAFKNATFAEQKTQKVLIQSDDTSVLSKFKSNPNYKRLLSIQEDISDALKQTVNEIKKFAEGIVVTRPSLISIDNSFTKAQTKIINEMRTANISVYVAVLRNEFVALPFDFYADPIVELATYVSAIEVDGVITEFPKTASRYIRSPCMDPKGQIAIKPAEPGALLQQIPPMVLPPADPPSPALEIADVVDPPFPAVANESSHARSSSSCISVNAILGLCLEAILALSIVFLRY